MEGMGGGGMGGGGMVAGSVIGGGGFGIAIVDPCFVKRFLSCYQCQCSRYSTNP